MRKITDLFGFVLPLRFLCYELSHCSKSALADVADAAECWQGKERESTLSPDVTKIRSQFSIIHVSKCKDFLNPDLIYKL